MVLILAVAKPHRPMDKIIFRIQCMIIDRDLIRGLDHRDDI